MAENIIEVKRFVAECNNMLSGKFLDLDKRLEKFLTVMTKSDDVVGFLAECLEDFDESAEFEKAFSVDKKTGAAKVVLPTDQKKKIALVITIFNNISNGKLNTNRFLETFFQDMKTTSTQNFLEKIILPFRDEICKHFEISSDITEEDVKKQQEEEEILQAEQKKAEEEAQFPHLDDLLAEIVKSCNQILAILKFEKKKSEIVDDIEFVTNSIVRECQKRDLMVVNGLVIGLSYISKKYKNVREYVSQINNMIFDYYEYLADNQESEEDF